MAEVLATFGAVAAACQLAQQRVKISKFISGLYSKVRDAPESIRKQTVQVEQLIDIARLVQHNPSLQTDLVASILGNCFREAGQLEEELMKISVSAGDGNAKTIWKVLVGLTKEEKILAHCKTRAGEERTGALTLLHTIYLEYVEVRTAIDGVSKEFPAIRDTARKVTTVFEKLPEISGNVSVLPSLDIKVATIHDELPVISRTLATIGDKLNLAMQLIQQASIPPPKHIIVEDLFMVPFARNNNFIGQSSLIEELSVKLEKGKGTAALLCKSQIALEYAYRRREKSAETLIYWVHASNALRFEHDYLQIGINAKLPGINDPEQVPKQLVKNWLNSKESGTWLMIVDNADDADMFFGATEIRDYSSLKRLSELLPQCSNGSIIFTTRNKKAGVKFATAGGVILLPKMDRVDAENLLRAHLGEDILDQGNMTELLGLLEYLPLAISQAASYIAENSISTSKYLQMYNQSEASRIELLSEDFEDLAKDSETKNPVAITWAMSFDQIKHPML